ncbi:Major Facilitator Superfamily protein [Desulfurella multipotens]|uniref:Major Facilitator Superfamily protein n=1 Tax=Desulfurella multipotens TaxID=79269 RepID=A0A1G6HYH8_9BACT|nr:MFS transporter [Desulfurella multipotens]SDB99281.1 Major Facilitator Superfamily protein [Desulfurella multipotens]
MSKDKSHSLFPLVISSGAFFLSYYTRLMWSILSVYMPLKPTITQDGHIFALYFFGYIAVQIPAGFVSDRFDCGKIISLSLILLSIITFFSGIVTNIYQEYVLSLLMGFCAGWIYPASLCAIVGILSFGLKSYKTSSKMNLKIIKNKNVLLISFGGLLFFASYWSITLYAYKYFLGIGIDKVMSGIMFSSMAAAGFSNMFWQTSGILSPLFSSFIISKFGFSILWVTLCAIILIASTFYLKIKT